MLANNAGLALRAGKKHGCCGSMIRPLAGILLNAATKFTEAHHENSIGQAMMCHVVQESLDRTPCLLPESRESRRLLRMRIKAIEFQIVHAGIETRRNQLCNSAKLYRQTIVGIFDRGLVIAKRRGNSITGSQCRRRTRLQETKQI